MSCLLSLGSSVLARPADPFRGFALGEGLLLTKEDGFDSL